MRKREPVSEKREVDYLIIVIILLFLITVVLQARW